MPSSAVLKVGQSVKRGLSQPPLPPQHPSTSRKTLRQFHRKVFLLAPHLQYTLPPSANALDPPLHSESQSGTSSSGSLASGRGSRRSRSSSSSSSGSSSGSGSGSGSQSGSPARSEASAGARSVRSTAVSVGSVEVLSRDQASEGEHDVSYSTDEVDVSQGSIPLLDISASDDDETCKRKARDYARRSDTVYAAWKEKQTSDGVKGIEERDQMVNDYMDGKRRPKNPDPSWPPCFLHGGPWGVPATDLSDQYFWAMSLLLHGPQRTYALWSSITSYGRACKEASAPGQHVATAVCPHGFPRWDCYCLGLVAGTAYAKRACPNPYLPIWRCQGRAQHTRVMLSILCVYRPKRSGLP